MQREYNWRVNLADLANASAMRLAGVSAATVDPSGGKVIRDAQNLPTGVFIDNAKDLVERNVPAQTTTEARSALKDAVSVIHRWGLTGVHDAGASRSAIDMFEQMAQAGELISCPVKTATPLCAASPVQVKPNF